MNKDCRLLVNADEAIIYASDKEDFAEVAKKVSHQYQLEMHFHLEKMGVTNKAE